MNLIAVMMGLDLRQHKYPMFLYSLDHQVTYSDPLQSKQTRINQKITYNVFIPANVFSQFDLNPLNGVLELRTATYLIH